MGSIKRGISKELLLIGMTTFSASSHDQRTLDLSGNINYTELIACTRTGPTMPRKAYEIGNPNLENESALG